MQWVLKAANTALSLLSIAETPQNATSFAIIYGLPLLAYTSLAIDVQEMLGGFKTNTFYHQTEVVNASFTGVVRPNVDTLYSEALVDLSSNNLIITVPEISDRFWVFPLYDAYGNNIANIGTAGFSSTPGSYLLTYRPAQPGYKSGDDKYAGYIYLPTPYGSIINRLEVNSTDAADVQKAIDLQPEFTLTPGPDHVRLALELTASLLFDDLSDNRIERCLQLTARLAPYNLPEVPSDIRPVFAALRLAGLSKGSYTTPSGVNLTLATEKAFANISSVRLGDFDKYFLKLGNDWSMMQIEYTGDFKSDYTVRAFVAEQAYLQLKADQAIYPTYNVLVPLDSIHSYNITFSGKPPVTGFWSLTVYNKTGYLVDNPWNTYALGDRSSIKYSNGSLVYGSDGDGEFSILLQSLTTPPPEQYLSNWIPTPALDASSTITNLNLRWYGSTKALIDGSYTYPLIKTISPVS